MAACFSHESPRVNEQTLHGVLDGDVVCLQCRLLNVAPQIAERARKANRHRCRRSQSGPHGQRRPDSERESCHVFLFAQRHQQVQEHESRAALDGRVDLRQQRVQRVHQLRIELLVSRRLSFVCVFAKQVPWQVAGRPFVAELDIWEFQKQCIGVVIISGREKIRSKRHGGGNGGLELVRSD
ncbi:hypothetical protein ACS49_04625 [Bacillus cereus]|nr:hypothetical protein ACS49_04625 [Bacillus cereus]